MPGEERKSGFVASLGYAEIPVAPLPNNVYRYNVSITYDPTLK
jgi:hypothetical protein